MLPSRAAGGIAQSSSGSGISFQGDVHSQLAGNSHLSPNIGNSTNTIPGHAHANICQVSAEVSNTVLNSMASSGPSVGASSLVTDANSGLSGGPHLQRSASINTESYMRLPASPLSFSSNNISISGSSVMDGSPVVQQSTYQDLGSQQAHQCQQHLGASTGASLLHMGNVQLSGGRRLSSSFIQEPNTLSQLQKKPRLDIKQEDVYQQHVLQQLSNRQDPMNLHNPNPQLQALIHQHRLRQQEQQLLQAMTPFQRAQLLQQQQQQQLLLRQQQLPLRQQFQLQGMPQPSASLVKSPYDSGVCSRRLMQYLYHERQRPAENTIAYWRKFVAEYYSPRAKKRWCLSLYNSVGHHSLGAFPQASMDAWQCDICGSRSGRGFEATYDVLPRLNEIKFGNGVIDELLFVDLPRECRFPSGMMMLEYAKAVQESVYEQLRVVREGHLRIIFTPDLKILSWEFCARSHEELLPRRLVSSQVTQKCQNSISESGVEGVPQQGLQANNALVVTAGRQLTLELQSLNDLGFSKRYVRCLQIADVFNSMKDLMDICMQQKKGPIEGLKNFPRCTIKPDGQIQRSQETDQAGGCQGMPSDSNAVREHMASHRGLMSHTNTNQHAGGPGVLSGSAQAAFALNNYQSMLLRQNSFNMASNSTQREVLSPFGSTPGSSGILLQRSPNGSFQHSPSVSALLQQNPHNGQVSQQHMIQLMLQDMSKRNYMAAVPQQSLSMQNPGGSISSGGYSFRGFPTSLATENQQTRRNDSCKASSSNCESPAPVGHAGFDQKASDSSHNNLHSLDEMVPHSLDEMVPDDFTENGFFNNDLDDDMSFSWKE